VWLAPFFSGVLLANFVSAPKGTFKLVRWVFIPVFAIILAAPFTFRWPKQATIAFGFSWMFAVNFIIFACYRGHCSAVNRFLSHQLWSPLAKMSLSIYLVTPMVQIVRVITRSESFKSFTATGTVWALIVMFLNYNLYVVDSCSR
jgi:hypothetical protein